MSHLIVTINSLEIEESNFLADIFVSSEIFDLGIYIYFTQKSIYKITFQN